MTNEGRTPVTKTFERFLRSFSDEDLVSFTRERAAARPPYWSVMRLALRIEAGRRGVRIDADGAVVHADTPQPGTPMGDDPAIG